MQTHINYVQELITNGGPQPDDYKELNNFFVKVFNRVAGDEMNRDEVRNLWQLFHPAFTPETLQGFALHKPHGYAGDFEIIDKIYQEWLSPDPHLANWDRFFHWQSATKGTRNRKRYFIKKFSELAKNNGKDYQVLNVGSGPARDISEFFIENPAANMMFHCIDMDENAITYAKKVCQNLTTDQVTFHNNNIFRFKNDRTYDLVWSAGLFDYLDDKKFIFLFKRLLAMLNPGGTIIIGNVSPANTSRPYMEFGEWFLFHRNKNELQSLAQQCGLEPDSITIEQESEGYNLFLVVNK